MDWQWKNDQSQLVFVMGNKGLMIMQYQEELKTEKVMPLTWHRRLLFYILYIANLMVSLRAVIFRIQTSGEGVTKRTGTSTENEGAD